MTKEDLICLSTRPQHERIAIARKGGQVRSVRKKLASQIKAMRRQGVTNARIQRWLSLMESEEFSVIDIRKYIDMVMQLALQTKDVQKINSVIKLMMEWHKIRHGGKDNDITVKGMEPAEIIIVKPDEN